MCMRAYMRTFAGKGRWGWGGVEEGGRALILVKVGQETSSTDRCNNMIFHAKSPRQQKRTVPRQTEPTGAGRGTAETDRVERHVSLGISLVVLPQCRQPSPVLCPRLSRL